MNTKSQVQMQIKGCLMVGVYAHHLSVYEHHLRMNEDLTLISTEFILSLKNPVTLESWYWRLEWFEEENGQDYLIIHEQYTPEPLQYMRDPLLSKDFLVIGSNFNFHDNVINKVVGYGYKDTQHEILTSLVFEFEKSYLLVNTGPVIEMNYVKTKPNVKKDIIFTLD